MGMYDTNEIFLEDDYYFESKTESKTSIYYKKSDDLIFTQVKGLN